MIKLKNYVFIKAYYKTKNQTTRAMIDRILYILFHFNFWNTNP